MKYALSIGLYQHYSTVMLSIDHLSSLENMIKKRCPRLAVYWLVLAVLLTWGLFQHGQAIGGGVKYLAHVGAGPNAALQCFLILCALGLSISFWSGQKPSGKLLQATRFASAILVFNIFIIYILIFIPFLGPLLRTYP